MITTGWIRQNASDWASYTSQVIALRNKTAVMLCDGRRTKVLLNATKLVDILGCPFEIDESEIGRACSDAKANSLLADTFLGRRLFLYRDNSDKEVLERLCRETVAEQDGDGISLRSVYDTYLGTFFSNPDDRRQFHDHSGYRIMRFAKAIGIASLKDAAEVSAADFEEYLVGKATSGRYNNSDTIRRDGQIILCFFRWCMYPKGYIKWCPMMAVDPVKVANRIREKRRAS